jgi:uncharacterized membrane protein YccC
VFKPETLWNNLNAKLRNSDWFRGLRAGTAISVPLLLGAAFGIQNFGWAALGGFEAIISDPGGPYRTRLGSLGTVAVGGALGCILGSVIGTSRVWAIPVTILFCFVWSYLNVLGQPFTSAGGLVQLFFFCGLGYPVHSLRAAAIRGLFVLIGGAWAMLLSFFLWPLDPYRPARFAIGACYQELGSFLNNIHELNLRKKNRPALWHRLARHHQSRLRILLEQAQLAIASLYKQARAETGRGRELIVLLESADLLLARAIALSEYMEMTATEDASPCTVRGKSAVLELARMEIWLSTVLHRRLNDLEETVRHYRARLERIPAEMSQCMSRDDIAGQFFLHQITDAAQNLDVALESAVAIRLGHRPRGGPARPTAPIRKRLAEVKDIGVLDQLRANWHRESLMLRHAARVALVCGLDVAILQRWSIDHGFWLPLTSLMVMQPHISGTFRRSLQRVAGTVAGGIFAAILAVQLHSQLATAIALFPLGFLALSVLPISYSLFCFFLTPTFVLAFLPFAGDWQLAIVRIINTVLGAVIAMAAMTLIFPMMERSRLGKQLLRSLQANGRYLEQLTTLWQGAQNQRELALARRATGLAHNDTEDSFERLLAEPSLGRGAVATMESTLAFVTYLRRFGATITSLASFPGQEQWKTSSQVQNRLTRLRDALQQLELEVAGTSEPPVTEFEIESQTMPEKARHSGERQLARLERQAGVLRRSFETMQRGGLLPAPGHPESSGQSGKSTIRGADSTHR